MPGINVRGLLAEAALNREMMMFMVKLFMIIDGFLKLEEIRK